MVRERQMVLLRGSLYVYVCVCACVCGSGRGVCVLLHTVKTGPVILTGCKCLSLFIRMLDSTCTYASAQDGVRTHTHTHLNPPRLHLSSKAPKHLHKSWPVPFKSASPYLFWKWCCYSDSTLQCDYTLNIWQALTKHNYRHLSFLQDGMASCVLIPGGSRDSLSINTVMSLFS